MTEEPQPAPLPAGTLDKLRQVSTSTLATQLYRRGFRQPTLSGVRPLSQAVDGFVGEVTITTRAAFHHVADLQVPIGCAGVAVYPGDVLVGDRDGVVVIPRALAGEIAGPSLEQEELEAYIQTRIKGGEPLWGNYPPSEETRARYKAWRESAAVNSTQPQAG